MLTGSRKNCSGRPGRSGAESKPCPGTIFSSAQAAFMSPDQTLEVVGESAKEGKFLNRLPG